MVTLAIVVRIRSAIAPQMGQSISWLAGCEGHPRTRTEIDVLPGVVCFCTRSDIYSFMVGGLRGCRDMLRGRPCQFVHSSDRERSNLRWLRQ
jgi:hypothetical protein